MCALSERDPDHKTPVQFVRFDRAKLIPTFACMQLINSTCDSEAAFNP